MDEKNQKKGKSFFSGLEWLAWLVWWKLDNTELEKQISQYHTLGIAKSWRGISALLITGTTFLTIFVSAIGLIPGIDSTGRSLVYLPVSFFVYRGKKWAILLMMALWTLEKIISVINVSGTYQLFIVFVWWVLLMRFLYGAFVVENTRKKIVPFINTPEPETRHGENSFSKLAVSKKSLVLIIIATVILAGWFYWFQWRPAEIVASCDKQARKGTYEGSSTYQRIYVSCLHSKGLR